MTIQEFTQTYGTTTFPMMVRKYINGCDPWVGATTFENPRDLYALRDEILKALNALETALLRL